MWEQTVANRQHLVDFSRLDIEMMSSADTSPDAAEVFGQSNEVCCLVKEAHKSYQIRTSPLQNKQMAFRLFDFETMLLK